MHRPWIEVFGFDLNFEFFLVIFLSQLVTWFFYLKYVNNCENQATLTKPKNQKVWQELRLQVTILSLLCNSGNLFYKLQTFLPPISFFFCKLLESGKLYTAFCKIQLNIRPWPCCFWYLVFIQAFIVWNSSLISKF